METGANSGAFSFRKLGSNSEGGDDKSSSAGDGNAVTSAGFIDPEIARATAGRSPDSGSGAPEPTSPGPGPGPGPVKRGRGRPRSDGTTGPRSPTQAKQESSVGVKLSIAQDVLIFAHTIAANTFKCPELELTASEARQIADALENLDQRVAVIVDPRTKAIYDLCRVCASVYGSRAIAIYLRKHAEAQGTARQPQPQPQPQQPARPTPQPAPMSAPVMNARENSPARPAPPTGVDPNAINDPLFNAVLAKKGNGAVPVVTGDDAPMNADVFATFDPKNIKVMN